MYFHVFFVKFHVFLCIFMYFHVFFIVLSRAKLFYSRIPLYFSWLIFAFIFALSFGFCLDFCLLLGPTNFHDFSSFFTGTFHASDIEKNGNENSPKKLKLSTIIILLVGIVCALWSATKHKKSTRSFYDLGEFRREIRTSRKKKQAKRKKHTPQPIYRWGSVFRTHNFSHPIFPGFGTQILRWVRV